MKTKYANADGGAKLRVLSQRAQTNSHKPTTLRVSDSPGGRALTGILKELKGTFSLEGIEMTEEHLLRFASDYKNAKERGAVEALIRRAKLKFSKR